MHFEARVAGIGAGLDPATRRLTARAEVRDPEHLLRPEMFATFHVALGEPRRSVAVPAGAVIHRGSEASVWVALDGTASSSAASPSASGPATCWRSWKG